MKTFSKLLIILVLPAISLSQTDTVSVRLDQFNSFIISPYSVLPNSNLSIISGSPYDTFFVVPTHKDCLLSISGVIGAETGEAMLNKHSNPAKYPNRDHRTSFSTLLSVPKLPLAISYKYLYTDEYTDHFDSIWTNYTNVTGKGMVHDEDGLRHEHLGALRYQQKDLLLQTSYNWYRRWNATPYYFSPVLSCGYSMNPQFSYSGKEFSIYSNWLVNKHSEYYDHINPTDYTDLSFTNRLSVNFSASLQTCLEARYDPSLSPGAAFSASLLHKGSIFNWDLSATIFNSNDASFLGYGSLHPTSNLSCSLSLAKTFVPQSRHFSFMEYKLPVTYDPISTNQINLYGCASYKDTLFIPFTINTWFQHINKPIWESVTFFDDSIVIDQMLYDKGESVLGINGNFRLNFKSLYLDCQPSITLPQGKTIRRFSIEKMLDVSLSFLPSDSNYFFASINFQYRDSSYLNYILSGNPQNLQTLTSPSQAVVYFHVNVPFIVPFIHRFTKNACLFVDAGPIRLSKTLRSREHPKGNYIGTAIYAGLRGNFW